MMRNEKGVGYLLVLLAALCWSTSGIFIRYIADVMAITPIQLAFWRDLCTFAVMLGAVAAFDRARLRVEPSDVPWMLAMGVMGVAGFHVLWISSVLMNGVSVATVIQSSASVFVALVAWLMLAEPLGRVKLTAIVLALVGVGLITRLDQLQNLQLTMPGLAIGLGSAIAYASFSLLGKKLSGRYGMLTIMIYAFGFAALTLVPFQWHQGLPAETTLPGIAFFAGFVLVSTLAGFGLYTAGLRRLHASSAAISANAEVAFAVLLSYFILGERLALLEVVGGILVMVGVSLLSLPAIGGWFAGRQSEIAVLRIDERQ